jgi:hypothetical protein
MRTTVDIPDPLYRELKGKAAKEGKSVKELVLRAVRSELNVSPKKSAPRTSPVIKSKRPGTLMLDNAKIFEIIPFP